ncbi:Clp protease N-terminal domain-containing protein [Leekyejoonella antrihumi]|uniref:Clp protease n=1 Tax=Leekyejoonella antrihumi TaxID=1660198 RepID=A0A563E718_9MICO|nr:Clp protease N-terminal domain-containing protein [Leekyejoonella antrihumi]TWP38011.1 Clp protease [Leekyejoonella antrihumi]
MFDRISSEIRIAIIQASGESREMQHDSIGPEHVLLGLLTNVRGSAYRLLTAHGMQFDQARETLLAARAAQPTDGTTQECRDDASSNLDDDRDALRAIGIDLDKVRDAVKSAFGDDLTEGWGERRGRRGRARGHGPHGRGGPHGERGERHGFDPEDWAEFGPRGGGRGRRGPQSRRFGPFGRFSPAMFEVMQDARLAMRDGHGFAGCDLLQAIMQSGDPVVDAMLATADNLDALRADVAQQAAHTAAS